MLSGAINLPLQIKGLLFLTDLLICRFVGGVGANEPSADCSGSNRRVPEGDGTIPFDGWNAPEEARLGPALVKLHSPDHTSNGQVRGRDMFTWTSA